MYITFSRYLIILQFIFRNESECEFIYTYIHIYIYIYIYYFSKSYFYLNLLLLSTLPNPLFVWLFGGFLIFWESCMQILYKFQKFYTEFWKVIVTHKFFLYLWSSANTHTNTQAHTYMRMYVNKRARYKLTAEKISSSSVHLCIFYTYLLYSCFSPERSLLIHQIKQTKKS